MTMMEMSEDENFISGVGPYMILTKFDKTGHVAICIPKIRMIEKVLTENVEEEHCIINVEGETVKVSERFKTIISILRHN